MSVTERAKGKKGGNGAFSFAKREMGSGRALALIGWFLALKLKVWLLYFLVKSAADHHWDVSVAIKSKAGKTL